MTEEQTQQKRISVQDSSKLEIPKFELAEARLIGFYSMFQTFTPKTGSMTISILVTKHYNYTCMYTRQKIISGLWAESHGPNILNFIG